MLECLTFLPQAPKYDLIIVKIQGCPQIRIQRTIIAQCNGGREAARLLTQRLDRIHALITSWATGYLCQQCQRMMEDFDKLQTITLSIHRVSSKIKCDQSLIEIGYVELKRIKVAFNEMDGRVNRCLDRPRLQPNLNRLVGIQHPNVIQAPQVINLTNGQQPNLQNPQPVPVQPQNVNQVPQQPNHQDPQHVAIQEEIIDLISHTGSELS